MASHLERTTPPPRDMLAELIALQPERIDVKRIAIMLLTGAVTIAICLLMRVLTS
jgi:hypothetical protein